jgi:hypothetical protein
MNEVRHRWAGLACHWNRLPVVARVPRRVKHHFVPAFSRAAGLCVALALCAGTAGCSDPADKAAKKRIFSAEDPPQAVAAASQKLPPQDAADNAVIARRILGMGAAEATERLGAHRYTATID